MAIELRSRLFRCGTMRRRIIPLCIVQRMPPSFECLIACFSCDIRTSILSFLAEHGPMTMGALAAEMGIAASTLSVHVGVMRDVGVVDCTRSGREIYVHALVGGVELVLLPLPRLADLMSSQGDEPTKAALRARAQPA